MTASARITIPSWEPSGRRAETGRDLSPGSGSDTVVGRVAFRSKPLAALSIVLVLVSALGGWHAPDDRDELSTPAIHNHDDHEAKFSEEKPLSAPEHCAFCHWLRALGSGAPVATQTVAAVPVQFVSFGAPVALVRNAARLALSSRAPPLA